jgi:hypothetical protein
VKATATQSFLRLVRPAYSVSWTKYLPENKLEISQAPGGYLYFGREGRTTGRAMVFSAHLNDS